MLATVLSPDPVMLSEETSAGPSNKPRSEGLMGEASTFNSTSPSRGSGMGTVTIESSNLPALVSVVRSSFDVSSCILFSFGYINTG